jgi:hypothetical protein
VGGNGGLDSRSVDGKQIGLDVYKYRASPGLRNGFGRRYPAASGGNHLVSGAYAQHPEYDVNGIGAIGTGDTVIDAVSICKRFFKLLHKLAPNKSCVSNYGLNGLVNVDFDGLVLRL